MWTQNPVMSQHDITCTSKNWSSGSKNARQYHAPGRKHRAKTETQHYRKKCKQQRAETRIMVHGTHALLKGLTRTATCTAHADGAGSSLEVSAASTADTGAAIATTGYGDDSNGVQTL